MTPRKLTLIAAGLSLAIALPLVLKAQGKGVPPADLLKPLTDSWPTYSGDYTGKRYSALKAINRTTVKNLTLAWTTELNEGPGGGGFFGGGRAPAIVGGEGTGDFVGGGNGTVKGSALVVDGVIYITMPDNAWALDARDGHELWHYFWKTRGGTHIANRGLGMWNNYLYMETPDNYLVSLDAKTGKERWHKVIADFNLQYFSTTAPIIVGNHVIVGTGNDLDSPGFLQSFDPETGDLQWKFYTVPMNPGDPGVDTWPSLDAARHGGAQPWLPGVYDPETKLYILGTGNPTPAYTPGRGEGDNLYTCSLVAVNVDTGKMAWYFQTSPHDMHDWDSAQTPILIDGVIDGKKRKLVSTAARNGYFFTLDRVTGQHIVTSKYGLGDQLGEERGREWFASPQSSKRIQRSAARSSRRRRVERSTGSRRLTRRTPGSSTSPSGMATRSSTSPISIRADRWDSAGRSRSTSDPRGSFLTAIDYKTGKIAWRRPYPGRRWRRWRRWAADDGWRSRVRWRRRRQHRCLRFVDGKAALALAHRQRHRAAADLHARRPAVPAGGSWREALHVHLVLVKFDQIRNAGHDNVPDAAGPDASRAAVSRYSS